MNYLKQWMIFVGIDVSAIQVLLNELLEVGALAVVLSDSVGLAIANAVSKTNKIDIEALGALSSIVIPQGEQVANYLSSGGNFKDTVIHTTSADGPTSVLAYSLDSDPKTCIMVIVEPTLEAQIIHEFANLKDKLVMSIKGLAVEIRNLSPSNFSDRKIQAFWDTLQANVTKAKSNEEMKRALLDAKDNFLLIHGMSIVLHAMMTFANKIKPSVDSETLKTDLLTQIKIWKAKLVNEIKDPEDE